MQAVLGLRQIDRILRNTKCCCGPSFEPVCGVSIKNILIITIAALICAIFILFSFPQAPRPFDQAVWKDAQRRAERFGMQQDLTRKHKLAGMTREQVVELLGEPENQSEDSLSWDMGRQAGARQHKYLELKMKNGVVENYSIVQH